MRIGLLSDTHDEYARTALAIHRMQDAGAEMVIHCGDLSSPRILEICSVLPCYFTFGNHDADHVIDLRNAAAQTGARCLEWGGIIECDGKKIGVTHGHLHIDVRPLIASAPDYLITGHSHICSDTTQGSLRRINPGALFRTEVYSIGLLNTDTSELRFINIEE